MNVQTITSNNTVAITCHELAGHRFVFPRVCNDMGTAYAAARCLEMLGIEFKVDRSIFGCVFVRITSGDYKGFYDAEYDYKTNELRLLEDRG